MKTFPERISPDFKQIYLIILSIIKIKTMIPIQQDNLREQEQSSSDKRSFSPVLGHTLKIKEDCDSLSRVGESVYNQRHNMIIVNPGDHTIRFYDTSTLLPLEGRDILELDGLVTEIRFCPENETYMITCSNKSLYIYNPARKSLKELRNRTEASIFSVIFINSECYALLTLSNKLYLCNLENEEIVGFRSKEDASFPFETLKNRRILVTGLKNGSLVVYRTDRLPKLPMICSVQAHQIGKFVIKLESVFMKNKEYIVTCGFDGKIHLWHLVKGRMRRLRSIVIGEIIHGLVFLEEYKMLAITYGRDANEMKFISLLSGRLKFRLDLQMERAINLF